MTETPREAIHRLQKKIDRIDDQIISKRQIIQNKYSQGPIRRLIETQIDSLLDQREAIQRNILQLKRIVVETQLSF